MTKPWKTRTRSLNLSRLDDTEAEIESYTSTPTQAARWASLEFPILKICGGEIHAARLKVGDEAPTPRKMAIFSR